jgi:hypothetical protein
MKDDRISCLACGQPIDHDAPVFPDVNGGGLGVCCAPTYADLLGEDASFVDADDEPMTAEARRALYDAHIAAGGKPTDSMARA